MSNKRKKRVRELSKKLGVPYQSASNMLRSGHRREVEHDTSSSNVQPLLREALGLDATGVLRELGTADVFTVSTGPVRAARVGASLEVIVGDEQRLKSEPLYFAECGAISMLVSREAHEELIRRGAAPDRIQVLRFGMSEARRFPPVAEPANDGFRADGSSGKDAAFAAKSIVWCSTHRGAGVSSRSPAFAVWIAGHRQNSPVLRRDVVPGER